ncbi:hypothetical protein DPEC_G00362400 [Dallia pectoralis]|nr:hypothetical protein DPEC_G00362400 [Dallia pectoralis]
MSVSGHLPLFRKDILQEWCKSFVPSVSGGNRLGRRSIGGATSLCMRWMVATTRLPLARLFGQLNLLGLTSFCFVVPLPAWLAPGFSLPRVLVESIHG